MTMNQKDGPKEGGGRGSHDLPDLGDQMEAGEREVASSANDSSSNVNGGNRVIGRAPMEDAAASGASDQTEKKPRKGSGIWPFSKKKQGGGGGGGLFSSKSGLFGRKKRKKRGSSKGRMNYNEAEDSELKIDEDEIWRSKSQPIRQRHALSKYSKKGCSLAFSYWISRPPRSDWLLFNTLSTIVNCV